MTKAELEISEKKEAAKDRVIYLDLLRIVSIFFVMMIHVSVHGMSEFDPASFTWQIQNFYSAISRWCVPALVMISGTLFLNREITIEKLFKKYILRIVIIYLVWSICYAFIFELIPKHSIKGFLFSTIKGHYHMWFLLMIVGLYMITPFLRKIVQDEMYIRYFLILSMIFALAIPEAISTIKTISEEYGTKAEALINKAYIHFMLGFTVYYVGGYYLNKITISKKQANYIIFLGVFGFIFTVLLTSAFSLYTKTSIQVFYSSHTINVCFEAVLIFWLFKKRFSQKQFSEKSKKVILALSKYSFGAYLTHVFVITILSEQLHLSNVSFNPLFAIPFVTLLVFIISFCISAILNHIPFIKDHLV